MDMKKFDLFELKKKIEEEREPKIDEKETIGEVIVKILVSLFALVALASFTMSYNFTQTIEYVIIGILGLLFILRVMSIIKNYKKRDN